MGRVKQHLLESKMSYWYHCRHSMTNGFRLMWLAVTSFVHAVFPQIWPQYTAKGVISMYNGMRRYQHLRKLQQQLKDS